MKLACNPSSPPHITYPRRHISPPHKIDSAAAAAAAVAAVQPAPHARAQILLLYRSVYAPCSTEELTSCTKQHPMLLWFAQPTADVGAHSISIAVEIYAPVPHTNSLLVQRFLSQADNTSAGAGVPSNPRRARGRSGGTAHASAGTPLHRLYTAQSVKTHPLL